MAVEPGTRLVGSIACCRWKQKLTLTFLFALTIAIYFDRMALTYAPLAGTNPSSVTSLLGFTRDGTIPFEPEKCIDSDHQHDAFACVLLVGSTAINRDRLRQSSFVMTTSSHNGIPVIDGRPRVASDLLSIPVAAAVFSARCCPNDSILNWAIHANMIQTCSHVPLGLQPVSVTNRPIKIMIVICKQILDYSRVEHVQFIWVNNR